MAGNQVAPNSAGGRPAFKVTPEQLAAFGALQCTIEEAAACLDVNEKTLRRHMGRNQALREAWENGKARGRVSLRRLQWKHASMANSAGVQMTIHLAKHHLGETEKVLNELSGPGGGPIELTVKSDSELERLITSELDRIAARSRAAPGNSADRALCRPETAIDVEVAGVVRTAEPA